MQSTHRTRPSGDQLVVPPGQQSEHPPVILEHNDPQVRVP
jgi:hypothetical protein